MFPELFTVGGQTVYAYGVLIAIGAALGFTYMSRQANKEFGIEKDKIQSLAILIIVAAFVGGKIFFYLEDPSFYFNPPANMFKNFRTGFVFYGSLLFVLPAAWWFFRKHKLPVMPMMDLVAITACIVHFFGRLGCLAAGCCYGIPTGSDYGIVFTDPLAKAKPLDTHLHPTQIYEATFILGIFLVLNLLKRHQRFKGQLFLVYVIIYAIGRGVIEIFRGDIRRGFLIEDILSHSQAISLVLVSIMLVLYVKLGKREDLQYKNET